VRECIGNYSKQAVDVIERVSVYKMVGVEGIVEELGVSQTVGLAHELNEPVAHHRVASQSIKVKV
tara:strand:- start:752 stop:946 length:195 start_codon:yes stop_codon:yes gene_type:complete